MANVVLVTGVMGSGKTLKVVADLVADLEKNESRPIEEKRTYYADISGLKIEGILPSPQDWRETPDHSYIIYDEAQLNPMFARKRGQSHIAVQQLTLARKRGHTIIFITQAPNRLHQDILDVIQEHYHLARPYGAKLATCYMWRNQAEKNPMGREAQRKCENKFLFTYPKKCFDYYESAQVANDGLKVKIPPKTLAFVLLPLALFAYAGYGWFDPKVQKFADPASNKATSATATTSAPAQTVLTMSATSATALTSATSATAISSAPAQTAPVQQITQGYYDPLTKSYITDINQVPTNVIGFNGNCRAYNYNAQPIQLSQVACNAYLKNKGLLPVIGKPSQAPSISTIPTTPPAPSAISTVQQPVAPPTPAQQIMPNSATGISGKDYLFQDNSKQEYLFK